MQPNSQVNSSSKKKNKKKNKNKAGQAPANANQTSQQQQPTLPVASAPLPNADYSVTQNGHVRQTGSDSDGEAPEMGALDGFQPSSSQPPPPPLTPATQAELLATANELYRQIEAAAAAALASTGGPNNPAGPQLAGQPNPQQANAHLRSFIKNALPLAAGLNGSQAAAGSHGNLSPEQMHMAAQQLAHVVQTTGWASLGLSAPPDLTSLKNASANNAELDHAGGTTIPLGSFTVPLHPHPDYVVDEDEELDDDEDLGSDEDYSDQEADEDLAQDGHSVLPQRSAALPPTQATQQSQAKKKNKKKKKATIALEHPPLSMAPTMPQSAVSAPPAPVRKQPPAPTRSAVPVVPQLTNGHTDSYGQSRNANHASQKNAQQNAAPTTPASVRPANAAAQAQALRDRQAAAQAAAQAAQMQQQAAYQPKASTSRSERDDIRDFWLGLSQSDRRQMVTVEKQSVLRKMKDVQRHNCTCAVCGRKRNLIEQELEVLYNSYTTELETYAEKQRDFRDSNGKKSPPPGPGPFPGSIDPDVLPRMAASATGTGQPASAARKMSNSQQPPAGNHPPPRAAQDTGKNHSAACPRNHHTHPHDSYHDHDASESESEGSEDEDEDEEDGEDGTNDGYDEEEEAAHKPVPGVKQPPVAGQQKPAAVGTATRDVFGGSTTSAASTLAAKNGVLTVADDLLKNDGQKFLEMMESIAYKRIQREKELAQRAVEAEADEEDSEDYDDEEDSEGDDEDEDDLDAGVPAEQRRDDGRRMFQIFAARMFEQRVLQAYREKVARERQEQLLLELDQEDQAAAGRDAKKLKDAQKKKAKKQAQKEKAEAERLKKEADKKAAEEEAAKAALDKAESDRKRAAEQAQREERKREQKAAEATRKAAEKQRRAAEEERRRQEAERQREKVAQDKAAAAAKKAEARQAREAAEKEKREKDKQAKEEREKAALARKAAEEVARKEREKQQAEAKAAAQAKQATQAAARAQQAQQQQAPLQPTSILQPPSSSANNRPPGMPATPVRGFSASNTNRAMPPTPVGLPPVSSPAGVGRGASVNAPLGVAPQTPGKQPLSPAPAGPFRGQPQQQQQPQGFPPMSPFGGRPPSSQGMMPLGMTSGSSSADSPTHSRPASTMSGMSASNMPFHQQSFGPIGLGPHPQQLAPRPPLTQGQSLPGIGSSSSIFSSPAASAPMNGVAPPPGFRRPSNAHVSPIGSSGPAYGNIGVNAGQPMQRNTSGETSRHPSAIGGPRPIGRPQRQQNGQQIDEVDPASLRSPTPPLTFGSAALLDDDDTLPDGDAASAAGSSSVGGAGFGDSSIWGGNGIWSAPAPAPEPAPTNARASILRARMGVICYQLTKEQGQAPTTLVYHDWEVVSNLLLQRFPDSSTATTEELIKCCELPPDQVNGGGSFSLKADPPRVLIGFQQD